MPGKHQALRVGIVRACFALNVIVLVPVLFVLTIRAHIRIKAFKGDGAGVAVSIVLAMYASILAASVVGLFADSELSMEIGRTLFPLQVLYKLLAVLGDPRPSSMSPVTATNLAVVPFLAAGAACAWWKA